jgi:hypothetical protein
VFGVARVRDVHTAGNGGLTAAEVVAHQNRVLPMVAHPTPRIDARVSAAIRFEGQQ